MLVDDYCSRYEQSNNLHRINNILVSTNATIIRWPNSYKLSISIATPIASIRFFHSPGNNDEGKLRMKNLLDFVPNLVHSLTILCRNGIVRSFSVSEKIMKLQTVQRIDRLGSPETALTVSNAFLR